MSKRKRDLTMNMADAAMDQESAELVSVAAGDTAGWGMTVEKLGVGLTGGSPNFTDDEMWLVLRIAHFGAGVITGRLLGRQV